jgi:hypothetical protein
MKVRPDVSATPATRSTDETRLKIGEPHIIRPLIGHRWCKRDVVAATIVAAEYDQAPSAGGARFAKGDLLGRLHAP